jgi:hypothetical protein
MSKTVFVSAGLALILSACEADRDRQFAQCELQYPQLGENQQPGKVALCMKAAGYKEVYPFCSNMGYTVRQCWE